MPGYPADLGYIFYLAEIFVPGTGLGELLDAWRREDLLAEKVSLAFGLGLAFDTVVLAVKTSGLKIWGITLLGIGTTTIGAIILAGFVLIGVALLKKRRFDFAARPTGVDLTLLLFVLFISGIILLWFEKYPIFPYLESPDFGSHVQTASALISGSVNLLPEGAVGAFYYGVHYQIASSFLLVGGVGLAVAQRTVAILVALSPLVVFTAARRIFSSTKAGLLTAMIYVVPGTVWFNSVFTSGLFPDFFGVVATLFFLAVLFRLIEDVRSVPAWVAFALSLFMLYFSHYSSVTILPTLAIAAVVGLVRKNPQGKGLTIGAIASVAPAAIGFAAFPRLVTLFLNVLNEPGLVQGGTTLSTLLAPVPMLSDMALEFSNDIAFIVLLALLVYYTYKTAKSTKIVLLIPLVWFLSLLAVSFSSSLPERFGLEALVPLTLMAGYGLSEILPATTSKKKRATSRVSIENQRFKAGLIIFVVFLVLFVNSWSMYAVGNSLQATETTAQTEGYEFAAMNWLQFNTPTNSTYVTASDWRFMYTSVFFGRNTYISYAFTTDEALKAAQNFNAGYIIVTYYVIGQAPPNPNLYPWYTIQQSANLTLVYSNPDVHIFKLT